MHSDGDWDINLGMVFKLAVMAFISLVLLAQAGAWLVHQAGRGAAGEPAGEPAALVLRDADATAANVEAPRHQHIGWNAGLWLVGLGLVAFGRQGQTRAPAGSWRLAKLDGPAAR